MSYRLPPRTVVGVARPGTFAKTILGDRELLQIGDVVRLLGYSRFLGKIHPMLADTLVGKRHPVSTAEHTLRTAFSALRRGDRRLASSRAVTAVVQAATAGVGAPRATVTRAEKVVFEARRLIQSLVIARAAKLGYLSRFYA